jgi:hypothetical protein
MLALLVVLANPAESVLKPQYGGSLKVSEDLLKGLDTPAYFDVQDETITPLVPLDIQISESSISINFKNFNDSDRRNLKEWTASVQDYSNPCHWMLDYPYLNHTHPNSIRYEEDVYRVETADGDSLRILLQSSCLLPASLHALKPFTQTQFGFEANQQSIGGRPFLNAIIPTSIDPLNPFLSLKLKDVDLIAVTEERFQEIKNDPDIAMYPGPKTFLFLKISNLDPMEIADITRALDPQELAHSVLNDHAEILLTREITKGVPPVSPKAFSVVVPSENPYRLLGERLIVQLEEAGLNVSRNNPAESRRMELKAVQILENNFDLARYLLLRVEFPNAGGDQSWFEIWDEMEAQGKMISLLIHQTRIAAPKNLENLKAFGNGMPDFSNAWILEGEVP